MVAATAARAIHGQGNVTQFGGVAVGPAHEATVDDGAAADAGGDGDVDDVLLALAGPEEVLPQGGGVAVVVDAGREAAERLAQFAFNGIAGPTGQVGRAIHAATDGVQRARRSDADGAEVGRPQLEVGQELVGGGADARDRLGGAFFGQGLDAAGAEDRTIFGDHAEGELRATKVESQDFTHGP